MINLYYINLDRSIERNDNMIKQLKDIKEINYSRIKAIDGNIEGEVESILKIPEHNKISRSCLGCTSSHLKAIKKAHNEGLDEVIIIEDDIDLTILRNCTEEINELWDNAKHNTDILQIHTHSGNVVKDLYYTYKKRTYSFITKTNGEHKGLWGTTGYIINKKGIDKIMSLFCDKEKRFNFDSYDKYPLIADLILYIICTTKVVDIPFINTQNFESTIQTIEHVKSCQLGTHTFIKENEVEIIDSIKKKKIIPRIIHMIISDDSMDINIVENKNIINNWRLFIWNIGKMTNFVLDNYPQYKNYFENLDVDSKSIFFSYLCVYHYGGIYIERTYSDIIDEKLYNYLFEDICLFSDDIFSNGEIICKKIKSLENKHNLKPIFSCLPKHSFMLDVIKNSLSLFKKDEFFKHSLALTYYMKKPCQLNMI